MRPITLSELKQLARQSYDGLWSAAQSMDRDVKLYCHWTGGHYGQHFDDYHISIDADGSLYVSTDNMSELKAHTWHRNTGAIGIAMACAYNSFLGSHADLGPEPPTAAQIESMAQVVCVLADALDLTIDLQRVMTHAEAADNKDGLYPHEPYGPDADCERWDLYVLKEGDAPYTGGDILRGKANFYRAQRLLSD